MDRDRFDTLTRLLVSSGSRRAALGALLGASLLVTSLDASAKKRSNDRAKGKGKDRAKKRKQQRTKRVRAEAAAGCCKSGNCAPGTGKNLTRCCFEGQNYTGKSFKSSNLTEANFAGANLTNAKFQSTNLTGACFVDATITGANFKQANLSGVIKCRTIINAAGDEDNSGCHLGTRCCPVCEGDEQCGDDERCCEGRCVDGACCGDGDCGVCQQCVGGQCQAVPDRTVDCNGTPLAPMSPGNDEFMCTTQPLSHSGVCFGGECKCPFTVYDETANICRCTPEQVAGVCPAGCVNCVIDRVCLNAQGEGFSSLGCRPCNDA